MHFRTDDKPAPGRLEIVHALLNTRADELDIEDLDSPRSAKRWLSLAGLWPHRRLPRTDEVAQLRRFRELIRQLVVDRPVVIDRHGDKATELNEILSSIPLRMRFSDSGEPTLESDCDGIAAVVGALSAIVLVSAAEGTWTHFKCCQLPSCHWAFYDYSKNHSGRWCSMKTCGSRHKARQYLSRKAGRQSSR